MLEFGACPQCHMDASEERRKAVPFICNHCGYTSANNEKTQNEIEKRSIIAFAVISIFVVATHIQLANWDRHAFGILPIVIKQTLGISDVADAEEKAAMCMDLKKWDCVESEYLHVARVDGQQWLRAADFQMKRAKYQAAAQSYYNFFQAGGQSLEASYSYAKALSELGQVDEATKYFDQVLAARPDVLQVTVVTSYVKLLMHHQRYEQAQALISKIRKESGTTGELFMDAELQQIKELTTASRD